MRELRRPRERRLVLVDADGVVRASDDGKSWDRVGDLGGRPAAIATGAGAELLAATHENVVKVTGDGGRTWQPRTAPL